MVVARLSLTIALRPFHHALGWLSAGLALLAWASEHELRRLAAAVGASPSSGHEVLFLAGLVGASLVLARCKDFEWVLDGLGGRERLVALALALAGGILGQQVVVAAVTPEPLTFDPRSLGLADLHLLGIAMLLGGLPLRPLERAWGLPALAWILPALLADDTKAEIGLRTLLDALRHLSASPIEAATRPVTPADMIPIAALALAAVLLDTSSRTAR